MPGGDVASGGAHAFSSRPEDRDGRRAWFPLVEALGPFLDLATASIVAAFGIGDRAAC